ncbi:hypothetical protein [Pseudomonas sp. ML96]|uniref:hypothetical protein n=1 Tax=Pseudomonas sp. ML96 TaxID=1523503 RepID=UPI0012DFF34C|nr:hypothetical protein [Pseudomonas sp. ML96]
MHRSDTETQQPQGLARYPAIISGFDTYHAAHSLLRGKRLGKDAATPNQQGEPP